MNFELNDEQQQIKYSVREFAESEPDAVIYLDRQEDNAISPPSRCSMAVPASSFTTMVIS